MKKVLKNLFWVLVIPYSLCAKSNCTPPHLSELDLAKSIIEYSLSGGGNYYMQDKNTCLKQSAFPYISIGEVEEEEVNEGDPEYFVQSKHNFTIISLKKIKGEDVWDNYNEVIFTVDAVKEKRKVKFNITLKYNIPSNSYFGAGCLAVMGSDHPHVVYQECYDSVQDYYKKQEEAER